MQRYVRKVRKFAIRQKRFGFHKGEFERVVCKTQVWAGSAIFVS